MVALDMLNDVRLLTKKKKKREKEKGKKRVDIYNMP